MNPAHIERAIYHGAKRNPLLYHPSQWLAIGVSRLERHGIVNASFITRFNEARKQSQHRLLRNDELALLTFAEHAVTLHESALRKERT